VFYRRKIVLALIEAFGGFLEKTDCQKLLFLFCLRRGRNYYDFFPDTYGSFSFLLSQDRNRLIDLGFLVDGDAFQLHTNQSFFQQITMEDRLALQSLVREVGNLRGPRLIRKTYLEYPYYTSRSKIAPLILKQDEYEKISQTWHFDDTPCLFTLGYQGLSIDAYLNTLLANNVSALIDVRKNPLSMKYGFSKTKLASYVRSTGMSYVHLPELGIASALRRNLDDPASYQRLFDQYYVELLPEKDEAIRRVKAIAKEQRRIALTCFEANYQYCHRHKIADYLKSSPDFTIPIVHLCVTCTNRDNLVYNSTQQHGCDL
jgi:uncharacterized protein (DUF488 family)